MHNYTSLMEIEKYLAPLDQGDYDEWIQGDRSLSRLARKHRVLLKVFKPSIRDALENNSPDDFIKKFKECKPEIDMRDREKAKERIEEELNEIEEIIESPN